MIAFLQASELNIKETAGKGLILSWYYNGV